jgi:delta 1-pyrroline-5-carboxylate dehydrogenase
MFGEETDGCSIVLQLATALVSGCAVIAVVPPRTFRKTEDAVVKFIVAGVPAEVINVFSTAEVPISASLLLDARLGGFSIDDGNPYLHEVKQWVARRDGPVVPLLTCSSFAGTATETGFLYPLSRHIHERTWTENLAARGGNTALFTLEE